VPGDEEGRTPVRYVLHIAHSLEGVSGWVERDGRTRQHFYGWLELLSLLERPDAAIGTSPTT
jgi:hypothetical protein